LEQDADTVDLLKLVDGIMCIGLDDEKYDFTCKQERRISNYMPEVLIELKEKTKWLKVYLDKL
jgi:hypothetical protein